MVFEGMLCRALPILIGLAVLTFVTAPAQADYEKIAVLEALDKITGRVFTLEAVIGSEVRFGRLRINPHRCFKAPPEQPPESVAFLEIRETRPDQDVLQLFTGWMFASSPGLSTLEHPIYDVIVLDCYSPSGSTDPTSVTIEPLPSTVSHE